ncbi:MAG TPA: rod shape-determining protein MreD [Dongiaceae bacterium]|nr:rod shape-determining protein MreD [Dongiaceae bacterium]
MISQSNAGVGLVLLSLLVAYVLTIMPLPEWANAGRPAWVAMVLIYWVIAQPHRVGVVVGWLAGLMLDVLVGNVLGQNALALAVIAYTAYVLHMRIRVFPIWQQCLAVLVLVGIYMLVNLMIIRAVRTPNWTMLYWLPVLVSALIWPWVVIILDFLQGRFGRH